MRKHHLLHGMLWTEMRLAASMPAQPEMESRGPP